MMVLYEETVLVSIYDGKPIDIEVPVGIYVYLLELDTTKSSWGDLIDVYIITDDDILFYGPLNKDFKQFNLTNWISKGESIRFQFHISNKLKMDANRWFVVNDSINIRIKGYEAVGTIDYLEDWMDDNFQDEWV